MESALLNVCLLFKIREALFAVETRFVVEIFELPYLQRIADFPPTVAGILNVRGEMLPIIDLAVALSYRRKDYHLNDFVIILKGEGFFFGIVVNEVLELKEMAWEEEKVHSLISKVTKLDDQIVFILDEKLINTVINDCQDEISHVVDKGELNTSAPLIEFCELVEDKKKFIERAHRLVDVRQVAETFVNSLAIVLIEGELFGIDLNKVREFSYLDMFVSYPRGHNGILGFMNFRGDVLTVLEILSLIEQKQSIIKSTSKILVVHAGDTPVGILVDDIIDIFYIKATDFCSIPLEIGKERANFIKSTFFYKNQIAIHLDLERVLDSILTLCAAKKGSSRSVHTHLA